MITVVTGPPFEYDARVRRVAMMARKAAVQEALNVRSLVLSLVAVLRHLRLSPFGYISLDKSNVVARNAVLTVPTSAAIVD